MENLFFKSGITDNQIKELIKYSNADKLIKINTNDSVRFANKASFNKWIKIPRKIYTIVDASGFLLGIIWFRVQELPINKNYGITFAIRIYGKARGKGLSEWFLKKAFTRFKKTKMFIDGPRGFWLETRKDNLAAIKLYKKIDFRKVGRKNKNGRIIMIQS